MQYALVSSTCKTTRRNMTLAVERDIKQQLNPTTYTYMELCFENVRAQKSFYFKNLLLASVLKHETTENVKLFYCFYCKLTISMLHYMGAL